MKYFAFFVLFVVAASKNIKLDPKLDEQWENFKKKFAKVYDDSEEITRRSIWEKKLAEIAEHNLRYDLGIHSYRVGINDFSDMEHEEFVRMSANVFLHEHALKTNGSDWVPEINAKLPRHVDWSKKGYVSRVMKQVNCKCCWAIAAVGAIEGQLKKKTGKLVPLSVQNLIDCSKSNNGCNKGTSPKAYEDIIKEGGIDTAASYPYTDQDGYCRFSPSTVGATISGYASIPYGDEITLKQAVATVGPIAAVIHSSRPGFVNYRDGIYEDYGCKMYDHSILIVGYGTDDGKDYWLIKNSWGYFWGMNGYAKVARNKGNMCDIASFPSFPVL